MPSGITPSPGARRSTASRSTTVAVDEILRRATFPPSLRRLSIRNPQVDPPTVETLGRLLTRTPNTLHNVAYGFGQTAARRWEARLQVVATYENKALFTIN